MFVLVAMSFVLAACGGAAGTEAPPLIEPTTASEPTAAQPEPTEAPAEDAMAMYAPDAVTGDIVTAGSSTVFPLSERMKQRFEEEGFGGNLTIDSIGSGAGIERFCVAGETDIANASRAIRDSEIESCAGIGRTVAEFQVGIDALTVVVSAENDFATNVSLEELALLFSTATNWSDVRPEWPAEPIQRFSPGTDSGTFDFFVEAVMTPANGDDADAGEAAILDSANIQLSEDDNVLVQGVQGSPYAIGYFGYAYYQENASTLKPLSVNSVEPTAETAESGEYPISRPLFIYSSNEILQEKPQVASFIYFYITNVVDEILDVGYFPVSEGKAQENLGTWNSALGMEGTTESSAPATDTAMYAPDAVTGDIVTAGSSTVFPLSERMKQRFEEEGFGGNLTIDSIGSGAGIERFCVAGETDIANASRAIKDSEIESCAGIGRTVAEFQVGIDALTIAVSAENDFLTDVTAEELAQIFSTATNWSDVRPEWPNEAIQRFSPGTDSGTFDFFVEAVMTPANGDDADAGEAAILNAANIQLSEDDNVLVQGVQGSPYAIGYFGYAYYQENADTLKALSVNNVEPTAETAESGEYPISRPLFLYTSEEILREKPQVASFILFYLENVGNEILDVGYFPVSEGKAQENLGTWNSALGT
jgi:phosphate binding protein